MTGSDGQIALLLETSERPQDTPRQIAHGLPADAAECPPWRLLSRQAGRGPKRGIDGGVTQWPGRLAMVGGGTTRAAAG